MLCVRLCKTFKQTCQSRTQMSSLLQEITCITFKNHVLCNEEVMLEVFFTSYGIVQHGLIPEKCNFNMTMCRHILYCLWKAVCHTCPHLSTSATGSFTKTLYKLIGLFWYRSIKPRMVSLIPQPYYSSDKPPTD